MVRLPFKKNEEKISQPETHLHGLNLKEYR